jgi:hypothetical protein
MTPYDVIKLARGRCSDVAAISCSCVRKELRARLSSGLGTALLEQPAPVAPLTTARSSPVQLGKVLGPRFNSGKAPESRAENGDLTSALCTDEEGAEATRGSVGRTTASCQG